MMRKFIILFFWKYLGNANTNFPTIMIGELGSSFIRRYWQEQFVVCFQDFISFLESQSKCFYTRFV